MYCSGCPYTSCPLSTYSKSRWRARAPKCATIYRERPHRVRSHVTHPGNVYGETQSPIDIEKEIHQIKGWKHIIRDTSRAISESKRSIPRPSSEVPNDDSNQEESTIMKLACKGRVLLISYLLSKAIIDEINLPGNVREWTFQDIAHLPKQNQEE